jgi:DNA-binding transcriptional LysR family regulator
MREPARERQEEELAQLQRKRAVGAPTERARQLATPIADILDRVRQVMSEAQGFDPATSSRRFAIGAPDGAYAVLLPLLLAEIRRSAPAIDRAIRRGAHGPRRTQARRRDHADFRNASRRVALTVSNFMLALAVVAESDLVAALPRQLAKKYAARFKVNLIEPPFPMLSSSLRAVAPEVVTRDAGLAWLLAQLEKAAKSAIR